MKIIQLSAENIKRLQAVEIKPDGNMVVIGGKNGAGKSSVLDSIMYALGGKGVACDVPVHKGERKGKVTLYLGDLTVTRTFTSRGGGTLSVEAADGVQKSPQAILDRLVGRLSFDPLAFAGMRPDKQRDTLKGLVGLDFTKEDAERKRLYDERTVVNREAKNLEAQLEAAPRHPDAPDEEVKVAELVAEQNSRRENNRRLDEKKEKINHEAREIERIKQQIRELMAQQKEHLAAWNALKAEIGSMERQDEDEVTVKIQTAEATNQKVRDNQARADLSKRLKQTENEAENLTGQIENIDKLKSDAMAQAAFPVEGLSFDADGVLLNGLPFTQASQAEQLRVSVAMGLAMNPELRVLLIRDGSLLDDDSLALVAKLAQEADGQVWIERVTADAGQCQVLIEDGHVKGEAS